MARTKLRKKTQTFKDLNKIRVFDFNLIPKRLFDQVKGSNINFDVLFKLNDMITASPLCMLYAFADSQNIIRGFMWADVQPLTLSLSVHLLSVDKEFQGKEVIPEVKNITDEICKTLELKRCLWSTTRPRAFERAGLKRSKIISMET